MAYIHITAGGSTGHPLPSGTYLSICKSGITAEPSRRHSVWLEWANSLRGPSSQSMPVAGPSPLPVWAAVGLEVLAG